MARKVISIIGGRPTILNGKKYRDASSGIWYKVDRNGNRFPLDRDRQGRRIKSTYIGGTTEEARRNYWEQAPQLRHYVDSTAKANNIPKELLYNRLNAEGFTDQSTAMNNEYYKYNNRFASTKARFDKVDRGTWNDKRKKLISEAFLAFGLDNGAHYINNGTAKLHGEQWKPEPNINEQERNVLTSAGRTTGDNIGIMAATLRGFYNKAQQDRPNNTPEQNFIRANAYYNRGPYTNMSDKDIDTTYNFYKRPTKTYGGIVFINRRSLEED